jgi:hypothetical protein
MLRINLKAKNDKVLVSLESRLKLEQAIHNLKMRFLIGIKSIDDKHDEKLKKLQEQLLRYKI